MQREEADVVVVGAGPAGAAAARAAADAGAHVVLLEKTTFPRDKVCGDGLTPKGVAALHRLGLSTRQEDGWVHNRGLRVIGGGMRLELPWPDLVGMPAYGAVRPRRDLDEYVARHAQAGGADLREGWNVSGPLRDDDGRVVGVAARTGRGADAEEHEVRAPVVIAADGSSARMALSVERRRREDRPMGVAYRRYHTSPRHDDDHLESWLELWEGEPGRSRLLPGYGWLFGLGDGTVNVGLGILSSSEAFQAVDYRRLLDTWLATLPPEWELTPETATSTTRGGALPMGFNRNPLVGDGLVLTGDAGGAVNPMNGEGIAYALDSGRLAGWAAAEALAAATPAERDAVLARYPERLRDEWGGYFTLGRVFVALIGQPWIMRLATQHGMPHPVLMRFVLKLLAGMYEPRGGDATDRVISALTRLAPAA